MNEFLIEEKFVDASGNIKKWSDIHFHYYSHQFQSIPLLKQIFTRSVSTDGNRNTIKVSKTKYSMDNPFTSVHSANMKYINDLSDITRPYICLDTGNSGNVFSKYYDNLMHECERNELTKIIDYDFKDESKDLIIKPKY
jgi:penicillin amidase